MRQSKSVFRTIKGPTKRMPLGIALLVSASCFAVQPALAQSASAQGAEEEVVVTGSRIVANGFQQPTPVTVVGEAEVHREIPTTIANYLNTLPSFGTPSSSANPGVGVSGGGLSLLNLRNLGSSRTLVLLDNRRVVSSTPGSGVDINTLPTTLISRIEVVTGGASAAWGADAVAGVVNFVLNHNYEGIELNATAGISGHGDNESQKLELTFGHKFAGGRGSIIAAADYSTQPDIVRVKDRTDWWQNWAVVPNPGFVAGNGQTQYITVPHAGPTNVSPGGVITAGPLKGTQFTGATGAPAPYNFGFPAGVLQRGGDVDESTSAERNLTNALNYGNVFAHARYELTDNVTAYGEASYGKAVVKTDSLFYNRSGNLTLNVDNAYLDATTRGRLQAAAQTQFTIGKTIVDLGPPGSRNARESTRFVAGLDGKLGDSWKWSAYYQHGHVDVDTHTFNNPLVPRFNLAVDAVRDSTGKIVCRSTLTAPTNGCVPLNVLGVGVSSPEALAWIFGTRPYQLTTLNQSVVAGNATGDLFALPAGNVSIAFGGEYTKEDASATQDADSQARNYFTGNFQPFTGARNVKEGFAEVVVPLLKDMPLAKNLELNAAGRLTDYSTSGQVKTWKIGVSDDITDDLRFRITRSRDIRAPSLTNLFTTGSTGTQSVFDPQTNRQYFVLANTTGNAGLNPEIADTVVGGLVYRPHWFQGLGLSVDYYNIVVNDAIASLSSSQTINLCFGGVPAVCSNIFRDSTGTITQINLQPTNFAFLKTAGVDYEANYRHAFGPGSLSLRFLATHLAKLDQSQPDGTILHTAGAIADFASGQPNWKGLVSATYDWEPFSATAKIRFVGAAKLDNTWDGVVDDNTVPSIGYLDLRASYAFNALGKESEMSFAIDNVMDMDPPRVAAVPSTVPYVVVAPNTRIDLYDTIGRTFRIGLRAKF